MIRIRATGFDDLEQRLVDAVEKVKLEEVNKLARQLEDESPVGATGQLKRGWLVALKGRKGTVALVNVAENSLQRVVGRGPGGSFSRREIASLARWAEVVLGVSSQDSTSTAYAIAHRIKAVGTLRWQSRENILHLQRNGRLRPSSPALKTRDAIVKRLASVVLR